MTDDEITARVIERARRERPEPTREQAHDAVAEQIALLADSYWGGACGDDTLTDIRHLEHAARLLHAPVPMLLLCPSCGEQHIDAPEPENGWTNPPHKSHLCHNCGEVWRPADVPTTGVRALQTRGKADTWPPGDVHQENTNA